MATPRDAPGASRRSRYDHHMKTHPQREPAKRRYRSDLREEQANATAARIVEATGRRILAGDRELSYTAIAREARVSVPTVYRHFPTRQELFRALHLSIEPDAGQEAVGFEAYGGLREVVRGAFHRFESGPLPQAGRLNTLWEISRAASVPRRRTMVEREVARRCPDLPEPERTWLVDLGVVLVSTAMAEAFHGYLELGADAASERVSFALETLMRACAARPSTVERP